MIKNTKEGYWFAAWERFWQHRLGRTAFLILILFCIVGVYAPFLASSKPLYVVYNDESYFPLFRYLLYRGFFTKLIDIFFNVLIFTVPLFFIVYFLFKDSMRVYLSSAVAMAQCIVFGYLGFTTPHDPAASPTLTAERHALIDRNRSLGLPTYPNWDFDLKYMTDYAKLNLLLRYRNNHNQHLHLKKYAAAYFIAQNKGHLAALTMQQEGSLPQSEPVTLPTLWQVEQEHFMKKKQGLKQSLENLSAKKNIDFALYESAQAELTYWNQREEWLQQESGKLRHVIMPLLSHFHWEDDAGGQQAFNQVLPWWELTRINRKDLLSALIFGIRISLVVGMAAVGLALLIGVPVGAFAGYYGKTFDIIICRLLEIWESMPVFFMLLMIVAILQSKSIFLVIGIIGFFSWTTFSRYVRGEFLKHRNLPYVEACRALGFRDRYIMWRHILPNALPPVLTLLPFAIMGAITSEAGLSFLGLGEEGSCSWGVLMDEGRTAFPQESYLLWPPAILLTILLITIAVVGDSLRDTLDPRTQRRV
jgi:peptide/nickel transport system permease protein